MNTKVVLLDCNGLYQIIITDGITTAKFKPVKSISEQKIEQLVKEFCALKRIKKHNPPKINFTSD